MSGGALVSEQGELLGLLTNNVRLSTGEVLPYLSFALPVQLLAKVLEPAGLAALEDRIRRSRVGDTSVEERLYALAPEAPAFPSPYAERGARAVVC